MSTAIEAAELMERLQWFTTTQQSGSASRLLSIEELAEVDAALRFSLALT